MVTFYVKSEWSEESSEELGNDKQMQVYYALGSAVTGVTSLGSQPQAWAEHADRH